MEVAQLDQDDTLNITSRGTTIGLLDDCYVSAYIEAVLVQIYVA